MRKEVGIGEREARPASNSIRVFNSFIWHAIWFHNIIFFPIIFIY
jgi:hypothetical protein